MGGLTDGILMIALASGYVVCYLAKREEKRLKTLGYLVGLFIIAFTASIVITNVLFAARMCGGMGKMQRMGRQHQKMMMQKPVQPQIPAK